MRISPINCVSQNHSMPAFKANLHVAESVKPIISANEKAFKDAAGRFDGWLKSAKSHISETVQIRKNSSIYPAVALERYEYVTTYEYPHEDVGYSYKKLFKYYEDLEFQMGNKICGFWFDKDSNADKLLEDFKSMFKYLSGGR